MADRSTRPKQSARRDDAISELSETNVSVDLGSLDLGDDTQRNDLLDDDTTIKSDILQEFGDPGTGRSEKDSEGLHSGDQPSRKQLEHEVQLLKIEVSQKNLLLENVRAQCNAHMDDLREKLADATREKAALHARVENELLALREDANRRHDQRGDEILELKRRQSQLESLNSQLLEKLEQSKAFLQGQYDGVFDLDEDTYYELRARDEASLSLREFVAVTFYEQAQPLRSESNELRQRADAFEEEVERLTEQLSRARDELEEERHEHAELLVKYQKVSSELIETRKNVNSGNYKVENFDRVDEERQRLAEALREARQRGELAVSELHNVTHERDDLEKEVRALRQTNALLATDKDYLTRTCSDSQMRAEQAERRAAVSSREAEQARAQREELYERYASTREDYQRHFEHKLTDELEAIRTRTESELDRLRSQARDSYELELRNAKETRDLAISERDRAVEAERQVAVKYEELHQRYIELQGAIEARIGEVSNEARIKTFELDRARQMYDESMNNTQKMQAENEKLSAKLAVLVSEHQDLRLETERRIQQLESENADLGVKLRTYENMEHELDEIVMDAARFEEPFDGIGVNGVTSAIVGGLPSLARRRMQQSVELARRVLQLERERSKLQETLANERSHCEELSEKLRAAEKLADDAHQPYAYLIEAIRERDAQIATARKQTMQLEAELRKRDAELAQLGKTRDGLRDDLQRLLSHCEELELLRRLFVSIRGEHAQSSELTADGRHGDASASLGGVKRQFEHSPPLQKGSVYEHFVAPKPIRIEKPVLVSPPTHGDSPSTASSKRMLYRPATAQTSRTTRHAHVQNAVYAVVNTD